MQEIEWKRSIPVTKEVDVCVIGGGPAGIAAAVTAARMGAKVFLAEKQQCFGGAATLAGVPAFMRFSDGEHFLSGGIGREVFDTLYGPEQDDTIIEFSIQTEKLKRIYDDMMVESGADFLFDTSLVDVQTKDGTISAVILQGHENLFAVKAKTYIDCTGDGTLSVMAGAPWEKGDEKGRMMPATLCSLWTNIDWNRAIVEIITFALVHIVAHARIEDKVHALVKEALYMTVTKLCRIAYRVRRDSLLTLVIGISR